MTPSAGALRLVQAHISFFLDPRLSINIDPTSLEGRARVKIKPSRKPLKSGPVVTAPMFLPRSCRSPDQARPRSPRPWLRSCLLVPSSTVWCMSVRFMYLCVSFFKIIKFQVGLCNALQSTVTHCDTLHRTAAHCNTLQQTVNALQHTATHCSPLQPTATYCNTLERTTTHYKVVKKMTKCNNTEIFRCCTLKFQNHPKIDTRHYYQECVAVCCSVLQGVYNHPDTDARHYYRECVAVCCSIEQCVAV